MNKSERYVKNYWCHYFVDLQKVKVRLETCFCDIQHLYCMSKLEPGDVQYTEKIV